MPRYVILIERLYAVTQTLAGDPHVRQIASTRWFVAGPVWTLTTAESVLVATLGQPTTLTGQILHEDELLSYPLDKYRDIKASDFVTHNLKSDSRIFGIIAARHLLGIPDYWAGPWTPKAPQPEQP